MSTKQRPVPAAKVVTKTNQSRGILYYTVGTQRLDNEGNFYIDETNVKEGFHEGTIISRAEQGIVIILEGDVLNDYVNDGFSYVDSNNGASNSLRKLKETEAAKAEMERKNEELMARLAELEAKSSTKATKSKGGSNE